MILLIYVNRWLFTVGRSPHLLSFCKITRHCLKWISWSLSSIILQCLVTNLNYLFHINTSNFSAGHILLSDSLKEIDLVSRLDLILMKLTWWNWKIPMRSLLHQPYLVLLYTRHSAKVSCFMHVFCFPHYCSFSGNYDIIQQPQNVSEAARKNVPFYMFIDEETEMYFKNSSFLDSNMRIGLWRIIVVRNIPYTDARRNGKVSLPLFGCFARVFQISLFYFLGHPNLGWITSQSLFFSSSCFSCFSVKSLKTKLPVCKQISVYLLASLQGISNLVLFLAWQNFLNKFLLID